MIGIKTPFSLEKAVTDKPRDWPTFAKEQRDRAAEAACHGSRLLHTVMTDDDLDSREITRLIGLALFDFEHIARLLESVGAQTRP